MNTSRKPTNRHVDAAASIVERVVASLLGGIALLMFAAGFPALVESHGASLLLTWPVAALIACVSRVVWRGL